MVNMEGIVITKRFQIHNRNQSKHTNDLSISRLACEYNYIKVKQAKQAVPFKTHLIVIVQ